MLQGDHTIFSIPDLFGFIEMRRLSGVLVIASPNRDRSFYFKSGQLVYALCNDPDQLLGNILVSELKLDPTLVERAIHSAGRDGYLGRELVKSGLLEEGDLGRVVRGQIHRSLREVVRWSNWAFHFRDIPEPENLPELRLSAQAFVFDLSRELDEFTMAKELFDDLNSMPEQEPDMVWVSSSPPADWHASLPHPADLLQEIDGGKSLGTILEESGHPVLPLAHALRYLIDSGYLVLWDRSAHSEASHIVSQAFPRLPVQYHVPAQIWKMCENDEPSAEEMEALITSDAVLTARTLRIGALQQHWGDFRPLVFEELLARLGPVSLHSILMAETLRGQFLSSPCFASPEVWDDAARSGRVCKQLARLADYPDPDLARAAGIIQDIGRLVLIALDEGMYQEVVNELAKGDSDLSELEKLYFEVDHCQVGVEVARAWGFPPSLRKVIRDHHTDPTAPVDELLALVQLGNQLLDPAEEASEVLLEALGLTAENLDEVNLDPVPPTPGSPLKQSNSAEPVEA